MKGYDVPHGHMGWIPWERRYQLFATDTEYYDYYSAHFEE